ncbi:hypothetical protein C4D60_Mb08t26260 [Musa balbisiana]|uniref:Uncharacterized protein n=1 Tax=Musa balbisiana TaxID=52838 RepID=A0A4S8K6Q4_MUSBA|nr:hypothetical protein C4D60_Mb08t26260 [Musa balbisiana]
MGRTPCCDKAQVKRGPWSPEEDVVLKKYIEGHGTGGNWIALPQKAGLKRCGKSCRLRWLNYLRPDIKHGGFTKEEDDIICGLYNNIGSRHLRLFSFPLPLNYDSVSVWSVIASQLPGRTDNDIKNYWNTKLKKRRTMAMVAAQESSSNNTTSIDTIVDRINVSPRPPPPPPPSTSPVIIPIVKNETYNCDAFLKPLVPSPPASATTDTGLGFGRDNSPPVAAGLAGPPPSVQLNASDASSLVTVDDGSLYSDWWTNGSADTDEFFLEFGGEVPMEFLTGSSDASLFDTETRSQGTVGEFESNLWDVGSSHKMRADKETKLQSYDISFRPSLSH